MKRSAKLLISVLLLEFIVTPEPGIAEGVDRLTSYVNECGDCNVILFSYSALTPSRLSMYGHPRVTDPETTHYASDSIIFDHHFTASNWPFQAQISLYTGKVLTNHGVLNNGFHNRLLFSGFNLQEDKIAATDETLLELAKKNGYETFFIGGKPHNNFYSQSTGVTRGADRHIKHCLHEHSDAAEVKGVIRDLRTKKFFGIINTVRTHFPHFLTPKSYQTDFITYGYRGFFPSSEEEFLLEMKNGWKDLMTFLSANPGVSGYDFDRSRRFANDDFWYINTARIVDGRKANLHLLNLYDQSIRFSDFFIGQIFSALKEYGITEKTIVIITSDVGANSFEEYSNGPMPSFSYGTISPESSRIPLIISHPHLRAKKSGVLRFQGITTTTDLYPTIAGLLAWKIDAKSFDGVDLFTTSTTDRKYSASYTYRPHRGMTVAFHNPQGSFVVSGRDRGYFDTASKTYVAVKSDNDYKKFKNLHAMKALEPTAQNIIQDKRYPNHTEVREGTKSRK